jgi:hypothetical protein
MDCLEPVSVPGYVFKNGSTVYGSIREATCATGWTGPGGAIICGVLPSPSLAWGWGNISGCSVVNTSAPTTVAPTAVPRNCSQLAIDGYIFGRGETISGSLRIVIGCAVGYVGSPVPTSVRCRPEGFWTNVTGCATLCGVPKQYGYTFLNPTAQSASVTCAPGWKGSP